MLLSQAAAQLGNKRLLIVPDGALQYIPFAALPDPTSAEGAGQPLIVKHEILSLPSASTILVMRHEMNGRTAVPKSLAVLADPVFDAEDERVKANQSGIANGAAPSISAEE